MPAKRYTPEEKFWEKVIVTEQGCWCWGGCFDQDGYGLLKAGGVMHRAHRVSYNIHKGKIKKGYVVRHTCNNPPCTNPEHLLQGTHRDNVHDAIKAGRRAIRGKHGRALVREKTVAIIKERLSSGHKIVDIANDLEINRNIVDKIKQGRTWVDV